MSRPNPRRAVRSPTAPAAPAASPGRTRRPARRSRSRPSAADSSAKPFLEPTATTRYVDEKFTGSTPRPASAAARSSTLRACTRSAGWQRTAHPDSHPAQHARLTSVEIGHSPHVHDAAQEDNPRSMNRVIVGLATTVLVSGSLVGLGAGNALADPSGCPESPYFCWCPGKPLPKSGAPITWDMNVCHNFRYRTFGPGELLQPPVGFCLQLSSLTIGTTGARTTPPGAAGEEKSDHEASGRSGGSGGVRVQRVGFNRGERRDSPSVQWCLWSVRLWSESLVPRRFLVHGSGWALPGCRVGHGCLPYLVQGGSGRRQCSPGGAKSERRLGGTKSPTTCSSSAPSPSFSTLHTVR